MATKQIVIRHYIDEYLTILGQDRRKFINLYFIDLLSSYGMNKITKSSGKDEFVFPGSSISAALISYKKNGGFKKIYANDLKLDERTILEKRLISLKRFYSNHFEIEIDSNSKEIDSNLWQSKF